VLQPDFAGRQQVHRQNQLSDYHRTGMKPVDKAVERKDEEILDQDKAAEN
jgi:hypothetical protein